MRPLRYSIALAALLVAGCDYGYDEEVYEEPAIGAQDEAGYGEQGIYGGELGERDYTERQQLGREEQLGQPGAAQRPGQPDQRGDQQQLGQQQVGQQPEQQLGQQGYPQQGVQQQPGIQGQPGGVHGQQQMGQHDPQQDVRGQQLGQSGQQQQMGQQQPSQQGLWGQPPGQQRGQQLGQQQPGRQGQLGAGQAVAVSGQVQTVDLAEGTLMVRTQQGEQLELHARPMDLAQVLEGAQIQVQYAAYGNQNWIMPSEQRTAQATDPGQMLTGTVENLDVEQGTFTLNDQEIKAHPLMLQQLQEGQDVQVQYMLFEGTHWASQIQPTAGTLRGT